MCRSPALESCTGCVDVCEVSVALSTSASELLGLCVLLDELLVVASS